MGSKKKFNVEFSSVDVEAEDVYEADEIARKMIRDYKVESNISEDEI